MGTPRFWILVGLLLLPAVVCSAQRTQSIVEWDGDSTYHFGPQGSYKHHKRSLGRVVEEKPIAGSWGCVTGPIDAAVRFDNRKIYLFFGSQYARYDMDKNACDPGYPKLIAGGGWPGLPWAEGIDAAVAYNGKAYFFKGAQYVRYDIASDRVDPGYPMSLAAGWPQIPWPNGIDAAVNTQDGKVLLFKGAQYVRYDIASERTEAGPFPAQQFYGGGMAPPAPPVAPTPTAGAGKPPVPASDPAGGCSYGTPPTTQQAFFSLPQIPLDCLAPQDKVIVNGEALDPPDLSSGIISGRRFLNYNASKCPSSAWPREDVMRTQLTTPEKELRKVYKISDITYFVLHETGSDKTAFNNENLAHFFIDRRGNIYQLLDLARISYHCHNPELSRQSIGVELANGYGGLSFISESKDDEKRLTACKSSGRCMLVNPAWYMSPTEEQLDSLKRLTRWLTGAERSAGGYRIKIPPKFPTTDYIGTSGKHYFLLGVDVLNASWYHVRRNYCDPKEQSFLEKRMCQHGGGVINHGVINGPGRRLDGGLLTLTMWLGVAFDYDVKQALQIARCVFKGPVRPPTSRELSWLFSPGGRYPLGNVYLYEMEGCVDGAHLRAP